MSTTVEQNPHPSTAHRVIAFSYSLVCYIFSVASLAYFVIFVSDVFPQLSINQQHGDRPIAIAALMNVGLIALFGLQHSIMARKPFKRWLLRWLPAPVERATYCLGSAFTLTAIAHLWTPMTGDVWQIGSPIAFSVVQIVGFSGWVFLLAATFQLDHFELFGLRQTFAPLRGKPVPRQTFKTPSLYRLVRHPIQLGVLIGMWFVPTSTINHLMLSVGMTLYIFIGLYFEEKDLIREFGDTYRHYRKKVAKVIPFLV